MKYPDQDKQYLQGAWLGDGVPPRKVVDTRPRCKCGNTQCTDDEHCGACRRRLFNETFRFYTTRRVKRWKRHDSPQKRVISLSYTAFFDDGTMLRYEGTKP